MPQPGQAGTASLGGWTAWRWRVHGHTRTRIACGAAPTMTARRMWGCASVSSCVVTQASTVGGEPDARAGSSASSGLASSREQTLETPSPAAHAGRTHMHACYVRRLASLLIPSCRRRRLHPARIVIAEITRRRGSHQAWTTSPAPSSRNSSDPLSPSSNGRPSVV